MISSQQKTEKLSLALDQPLFDLIEGERERFETVHGYRVSRTQLVERAVRKALDDASAAAIFGRAVTMAKRRRGALATRDHVTVMATPQLREQLVRMRGRIEAETGRPVLITSVLECAVRWALEHTQEAA